MIKKLMQKELVKDNLVLFIGTLILNVFGFLFHFYMGRSLGPEHYGALGAALSILYLMNIPLNTIQTGIAKFTSLFKLKNEPGKIKYLFIHSLKKLLIIGIIGLAVFLILSPFIAKFLKMDVSILFVLSPFMVLALLLPVSRGVLQGIQDFKSLSINLSVEGIVKFALGIVFVLIGYNVNGAIGSIIAAYVIAFLLGMYTLRKIFKSDSVKINNKEVYSYSTPILIMLVSLTLFYSIDIILVKHFFSPIDAGYYSAISLIGKIIFFGSVSISQVMFPKTAELYQQGKKHKSVLYKSLGIITLFILPVILIYFLIPGFIVNLLYGSNYLSITPLIGWFGIFIGLTSFIYLICFYYASINKRNFLYLLLFFNVIEIVGVFIFHSSLAQVITVLTTTMLLLFFILVIGVIFSKDGRTINNNTSV